MHVLFCFKMNTNILGLYTSIILYVNSLKMQEYLFQVTLDENYVGIKY